MNKTLDLGGGGGGEEFLSWTIYPDPGAIRIRVHCKIVFDPI